MRFSKLTSPTFLFLFLLPLHAFGQPYSKAIQDFIRKNPPPNGILLHDNLYMDESEVANVHWLEYLFHLHRDSAERVYNKAYPFVYDLQWPQIPKDSVRARNLFIANHYLRSTDFRYFPVVGITKEQAESYCRWRSDIVNLNKNKQLAAEKRPFRVKYTFRLPTEKEWEQAAFGGLDSSYFEYGLPFLLLPRGERNVRRYKNREKFTKDMPLYLMFNCTDSQDVLWSKGITLNYIYNYPPNERGIYNMIGNAAELVQEDGIAKGGSWIHSKKECRVKQRQLYTCPTEWLGFRCISTLEILELPTDTLKESASPIDWYKADCEFVRQRQRFDTTSNFERILSRFHIVNNEAFELSVDEKTIGSAERVEDKVDFESKKYKFSGFRLKIKTSSILHDSLSIHLVRTEGPDVLQEFLKTKEDGALLEVKNGALSFDAIIAILYQKTGDPKRFRTFAIARKI